MPRISIVYRCEETGNDYCDFIRSENQRFVSRIPSAKLGHAIETFYKSLGMTVYEIQAFEEVTLNIPMTVAVEEPQSLPRPVKLKLV